MHIQQIKLTDIEKLGDYKQVAIRQLRVPLLEAFDIYKSNINYGIEIETDEERTEIIIWYQNLLNLNIEAIINVPSKIQRYVK